MGYKAYSDSYLMSLTKAEIIELLRVTEHNFFATEEALNNSAKAGMEIAEKFEKAKRLLKLAVEDFETIESNLEYDEHCVIKTHSVRCDECPLSAATIYRCKWRHADEALKLIEG
jgi:hypothetical protein